MFNDQIDSFETLHDSTFQICLYSSSQNNEELLKTFKSLVLLDQNFKLSDA